jgi:hypothetical protein
LDWETEHGFEMNFVGESWAGFFFNNRRERLRPDDFDALSNNVDFSRQEWGVFFGTSYFSQVSARGVYFKGTGINFVPPEDDAPFLADKTRGRFTVTVRPLTPLRIDNNYFLTQFQDRVSGANIFTNHIIRSKWNWQFNRELSLRVILQYDSTLANPELTELETAKNVNTDFLFTYLINPWTALFIGYNGNAQNILLCEGPAQAGSDCPGVEPGLSEIVHPRRQFINDAKQFFVKFSYLIRF